MSQSPSSRSTTKASKQPSRRTRSQSKNTASEVGPDLVQQLVDASQAHVRDLRILLDKSAEREAELASLVRMVMEERFYRPSVVRDHARPRETAPNLPIESLNDVSTFDSEADRKRIEEGEKIAREIEDEFAAIVGEHNAAHS